MTDPQVVNILVVQWTCVLGTCDDGRWVVTRYADVKEVSDNSEVFSNLQNAAAIRLQEDMEREQRELLRCILLDMDPARPAKLRGIISRDSLPAP